MSLSLPLRRPLPRKLVTAGLVAAVVAGGAGAAAVAAQPAGAAVPTCAASNLYLSMGRQDHGAGQLYWPIRFTNTGTGTCALRGYPGVSVLDVAHRQIGPAAGRSGQSFSTVTLRPAQTVSAVIHTTNGPIGGPCRPTGTYLRVYPPASHQALLVPASLRVCSNVFTVGPVSR
ncbi:hypothetical protein C3489_27565 [Streptomyces sp. Ru71]|uniref:DUF4232 domain-containing protein n=1 Tax=Streptomyces sp. Ru71 TaxID=2080746 RepID=UPI000CDD5480|nr:DUF4232 domain-containing protein [Streptomyces sp. Ru71]POX48254.1 hypothetical protein C3489_27565 [Streptomyces sp. Ru71]